MIDSQAFIFDELYKNLRIKQNRHTHCTIEQAENTKYAAAIGTSDLSTQEN